MITDLVYYENYIHLKKVEILEPPGKNLFSICSNR